MKINELQLTKRQITNQGHFKVVCMCILCAILMINCTKNDGALNPQLSMAEEYFWMDNYIAGDSVLYAIDTAILSLNDKYVWQMLHEHFVTYKQRSLAVDSALQQLVTYFEKKKIYHYAAYGYYLQGWRDVVRNHETEAMLYYKKAEDYALYNPQKNTQLLANLYYKMAQCSKIEGALEQSVDFCNQAIYYAHQVQNFHIISSSYKSIANTNSVRYKSENITLQDVANQYDSAIYYYNLTSNKKLGNCYIIQYNKASIQKDSMAMFYYSKQLVDSFNFLPSAVPLIEYYVLRQNVDSARYYLDVFAPDTMTNRRNTRWSKDCYDFFEASCLLLEGDGVAAAEMFRKQYQELKSSLAETENTRTYAVSRKYDVEKEKREKLELELEKKGLTVSLVIAGACIIVCILILLVYREYTRRKQERMQKNQEILEQDLTLKRDAMRQNFFTRVELTRDLYLSKMRKETTAEEQKRWPAWLVRLVNEQTFAEPQKVEQLFEEFNVLYYNMLVDLSKQYPALTQADLLMIVFIVLRLPVNDICVLLNTSKPVIWNRKTRIRNHMNLPEETTIDDYLLAYADQLTQIHIKDALAE